jgi:AmiR/NasT family two-component response regulator
MCRLLVVDDDQRERRLVADLALTICDTVEEVPDSVAAAKVLRRSGRLPDLIVAALDTESSDAIEVLELRHTLNLSMPVLLIVEPDAEVLLPKARSFGTRSFVRRPLRAAILDQTLREAVNEF